MNSFELAFNELIVETFHFILKEEMMFVKSLTGYDVTAREIHLMENVGKLDGNATVSDIAESLQITLASITVMVNKLEAQGYVQKRKDEKDARAVRISLTDKGREIDERHTEFHRNMVEEMMSGFTAFEREVLAGAAKKLNNFFSARQHS